MKNKKLVLGTLLVFVIAFLVATSFYKSGETNRVENMSSKDAPFIRDHSPRFGTKSKKVVVVEFLDPQCEACARFHPIIKKVFNEYDEEIQLVIRYLANHQNSAYAVAILEASRKQNKYNEVLETMFITQNIWADHNSPKPKLIWNYLTNIKGLDIEKLERDFKNSDIKNLLSTDRMDASTLGVRGTPTFFVNGKKLQKLSYQNLLDLVESEIYK